MISSLFFFFIKDISGAISYIHTYVSISIDIDIYLKAKKIQTHTLMSVKLKRYTNFKTSKSNDLLSYLLPFFIHNTYICTFDIKFGTSIKFKLIIITQYICDFWSHHVLTIHIYKCSCIKTHQIFVWLITKADISICECQSRKSFCSY